MTSLARRASRRPSVTALVAFVGLALVADACAPLGLYRPGDVDNPEEVDVVLYDASIALRPTLVARGKVGLEILNQGELEHGVRIVGPGIDEQSDEFLVPGQRLRMTVKLGPGTYVVSCPDGNHAALGMRAELVVVERTSWFRR